MYTFNVQLSHQKLVIHHISVSQLGASCDIHRLRRQDSGCRLMLTIKAGPYLNENEANKGGTNASYVHYEYVDVFGVCRGTKRGSVR